MLCIVHQEFKIVYAECHMKSTNSKCHKTLEAEFLTKGWLEMTFFYCVCDHTQRSASVWVLRVAPGVRPFRIPLVLISVFRKHFYKIFSKTVIIDLSSECLVSIHSFDPCSNLEAGAVVSAQGVKVTCQC